MHKELQTNSENEAIKTYAPHIDIYEADSNIVILADMPGVDETSVDVTLEKNVLSINGTIEANQPDDHNLAYAEYEVGNYQRSFTLSSVIDQEHIDAAVKDGVLSLTLPKVEPQMKKIAVQAA